MHADRTSRVVLTILGVLLAAVGVLGLLAGTGVLGDDVAKRSLLDNSVARYVGAQGDWFWPVVALLALVMAAIALRWLAGVLLSTDRVGEVVLPPEPSGTTTVVAAPLVDAVRQEIESYPGVRSVRTRLIGSQTAPLLAVEVVADRRSDVSTLRQRIETGALRHARQCLGEEHLPVRLDVTVTTQEPERLVA